jgi:ankyrin repeat protein
MVHVILRAGADPNMKTRYGNTPLMYIFHGSYFQTPEKFDIIKLLIDYGADPNIPDDVNNTPYTIMEDDLGYYLTSDRHQELLNILEHEQPKDPGYW